MLFADWTVKVTPVFTVGRTKTSAFCDDYCNIDILCYDTVGSSFISDYLKLYFTTYVMRKTSHDTFYDFYIFLLLLSAVCPYNLTQTSSAND